MSLKIKISILAICFALLAAVCVGFAFAAPNEKLNLKGTLSYEVAKATLTVSPNLLDLGSTTGSGSITSPGSETGSGEYAIGETVTLTATPSSGSNSSFLAWATSTDPETMEILSTSPTYSFIFTEDSPTTYFALFNDTTSEQTDGDGDLEYTIYEDAKLAMITGKTDSFMSELKDFTIPSVVSSGENSYKVFIIGPSAFYGCGNLTSITIPEGVTLIVDQAFGECSNLTSVSLPSSLALIRPSAFSYCRSLEAFNGDGNEYYTIDDGRAIITNGGKTLLAYAIGNAETSYEIPEEVTSIGDQAFGECSNLTSVSLPSTLTSIGSMAFLGCSGLTEIEIPERVTSIGEWAFNGCSNLTSITIPEGVTSIDSYTFYGCSSLTSVSLPSSLTSIDFAAFAGCSSLTEITIPDGVTSIDERAFPSCYALAIVYNNSNLEITAGSTENGYVGYYAKEIVKKGGTPQGKIEIDGGVQYYVNGATIIALALAPSVSRDSLTSITIREETTGINQYAFSDCSNLTTITIPEGVTEIGERAFYCCFSLAIVYNNSRLNITAGSAENGYVGEYAKEIVASGEEAVGEIVVEGNVRYYVNGTTIIALALSVPKGSLTSVTIREGTTEINQHAFSECSSLISVSLPSSLTSIGESAFENCDGLTEITIPESVTSIGIDAFRGCSYLEEITINGNITLLGSAAFLYCFTLTKLTIGEGVTSLPSGLFTSHLTHLTEIVVEAGSKLDENIALPSYATWYKDGVKVTSFSGAGTYSTTKPE